MISPRGFFALCFLLVIAVGWTNRLFAEPSNQAPTSPPAVTAAPAKLAPAEAPLVPEAARQPMPTSLSSTPPPPTQPLPAKVAPAEPAPPKIAPREPTLAKSERPTPGAADSLTPARLFAGPSMFETGRVAKMAVSGGQIQKTRSDHGMPQEPSVQQMVGPEEMPAAPPSGKVNQMVLGREIKSRFAALGSCRTEVARHGKIASITGSKHRLKLRWTILPSGRVADTAVIATGRVNLRVMDCVKRRMSVWSFSPPRGGSVHVERSLTFGSR